MSSSLIENALGHSAKIRVLRTLRKPGYGHMSINQLAQVTSLNAVTLARTLRSLQNLGIANYIQAGKSQLWRLSEGYASSVIGPILDAMEKTPDLVDQLRELVATSTIPETVDRIVLFGSVARGDYQPGSDIDLFILWSKFSYYDQMSWTLPDKISKRFWMTPSCLHKTTAEFKKMTPELKKNINAGTILYEKKQDKRSP